MNKTYRNIWNAATCTWTAVAETAKAQSKGSARAALCAVAAVVALGTPFGATMATEVCSADGEQAGAANTANACTIAPPSGTQSRSITPTATLDDAYIKVLPATLGGTAATASGSAAVAIGNASVANGTSVLAFGSAATATGTGSMAFGRLAQATGPTGAIAIGNDTLATGGTGATAIGNNATANGTSVLAVGSSATATGSGSVALGRLASATASSSTALGNQSSTQAVGAVALGNLASVSAGATNSIAIGNNASIAANVTNAMALGTNATTTRNDTISVGSAALQRQIVNMAAGTQATDAVNVSQLTPVVNALGGGATIDAATGVVTGPTYALANGGTQTTVGGALGAFDGALTTANGNIAANAADIAGLGTQVTNIDGRVTAVDSRVTVNEANIAKNTTDIDTINAQLGDLSSGTIGLVQQAGAGADLTVGANTDGAAVNFAGTAGARKLTGLANGDIAAGSTDAITGDQLHTTNVNVASLDQRVTSNETSITQIRSDMNSGTIGLVQQASAGADLTVGANTDGAAVNFAGTAGARKLTGLSNGDVAAGSTDAVTGDQLHATNEAVARNASDIATNQTDIATLNSQLAAGQIGLVRQDAATGAITVGAATGGSSVNFAGTGGARTLSGVANGVNDDDAATIAQLKATGLIDYTGKEIAAVTYDDLSLGSATFGGVGGTVLHNVAPGLIAAGSMDAVNGGQLYAMQQDFESRFSDNDDRVTGLESGGVPGNPGGPGNGSGSFDPVGSGDGSVQLGAGADASGSNGTALGNGAAASNGNATAIGAGSNASGNNGTAIGQGSIASGDGGTAVGQGANASGNNAVALGAGSLADRDNAVSVGSAGNERQITNVAAGTAPTDAVNVQQMQNSVHSARQDAMGGVAAAMAVAGLPQSTQPGRTFVAMAGSTYGGEYGSALGVSYMTRDGKWTIKASANTSSRGTVGAVVGGGFYW